MSRKATSIFSHLVFALRVAELFVLGAVPAVVYTAASLRRRTGSR